MARPVPGDCCECAWSFPCHCESSRRACHCPLRTRLELARLRWSCEMWSEKCISVLRLRKESGLPFLHSKREHYRTMSFPGHSWLASLVRKWLCGLLLSSHLCYKPEHA